MKTNLAIVILVRETTQTRVVTARVDKPWSGNIYEDYSFLDNEREFKIGDEIEISAAHPVSLTVVQEQIIGKAGRITTAGGDK